MCYSCCLQTLKNINIRGAVHDGAGMDSERTNLPDRTDGVSRPALCDVAENLFSLEHCRVDSRMVDGVQSVAHLCLVHKLHLAHFV